jgi:hypothetical protein
MRSLDIRKKGLFGSLVNKNKLVMSYFRSYLNGPAPVGVSGGAMKALKRIVNLNLINDDQVEMLVLTPWHC